MAIPATHMPPPPKKEGAPYSPPAPPPPNIQPVQGFRPKTSPVPDLLVATRPTSHAGLSHAHKAIFLPGTSITRPPPHRPSVPPTLLPGTLQLKDSPHECFPTIHSEPGSLQTLAVGWRAARLHSDPCPHGRVIQGARKPDYATTDR